MSLGGRAERGRAAGAAPRGRGAGAARGASAGAAPRGRAPPPPRSGGRGELVGTAGEAGGLWEVDVPLVGLEGLGGVLGAAYPRRARHRVLVVGCTEGLVAFDFLPLDPLAPATMGALVQGRGVPGEVRERRLKGKQLPGSLAVRRIGALHRPSLALRRARAFNAGFDPDLKLFRHDCEVYARELAEHLQSEDRF